MERLSFAEESTYSGLEASIHIARYALARDVCRGRKVLDLACGEGYGSRLMLDWGAKEVVGVDVSEDTVTNARARFGCDGLRYLSGDAEKVGTLLAGEMFDLIISLETIEHLHNPIDYLEALTRLRAPGGEIFISCPNDWWYYPESGQGNQYHIRKYSYDEFIALVTPVLGEPDAIAIGLPVAGFINIPMMDVTPPVERLSQIAMMSAKESRNSFVVPIEPGSVAPTSSSYFVARWGCGGDAIAGAGILPVPMDVFRNGLYESKLVRELQGDLKAMQAQVENLNRDLLARRVEIEDLKTKLMSERVQKAATLVENDVLRGNLMSERVQKAATLVENDVLRGNLMSERGKAAELAVAAHRYFRLRGMIPAPAVSLGRHLLKLLRGGK